MRVREVAMDGFVLKVSPFTYDQVDEFIKQGKEMLAKDPKPTMEDWEKRTIVTVSIGLNNAANGDGEKWTPERVRKEIDLVFVRHLHKEIIEMSGLEFPKDKAEVKGEAAAASTSSTSS